MLKLKWYNNNTDLYNKQLEIDAASRIRGASVYSGKYQLHEIPTSLRLVKYVVSYGKLRYYVGINTQLLPNVKEDTVAFEIENPPEDFYTVDFPRDFPVTDAIEAEALGLTLNEGDFDFTNEIPLDTYITRFCTIKHKYRITEEVQIGTSTYKIARINITALQAAMYDLTGLVYPRDILIPYTYRNIGNPIWVRDVMPVMPTVVKPIIIDENVVRDID